TRATAGKASPRAWSWTRASSCIRASAKTSPPATAAGRARWTPRHRRGAGLPVLADPFQQRNGHPRAPSPPAGKGCGVGASGGGDRDARVVVLRLAPKQCWLHHDRSGLRRVSGACSVPVVTVISGEPVADEASPTSPGPS